MAYRESARAACDVCECESVRTGKDGRPYCGMHGEPRAVIEEWQVERLKRIEALSRRLLAALPRCRYDGPDVRQRCEARAMWVCFDLTCAPEFRCDAHKYEHAEIGGCFDHAESHAAWWADAARELARELGEGL